MKWPTAFIVIAQFFGVTLWFSANGVAENISKDWGVGPAGIGVLLSAVQAGFILGTLGISLSGLADRFLASRIFVASCVAGGLANAAFAITAHGLLLGSVWRFLTGICLGGIYPLGMKLVVSWSPDRRESALGWLVGMLTLGTAAPHIFKAAGTTSHWQTIVLVTSALAWLAALLVFLVGDGPHLPYSSKRQSFSTGVASSFRNATFRSSAFGYFGHMWELYAFWAVVPLLVQASLHGSPLSTSIVSFGIIGIGAVSSVLGGQLGRRIGSAQVAAISLGLSALICLAYPIATSFGAAASLVCLFIWGFAVIPDSPQFSALSAVNAPSTSVGSALAVQNGIGFLITMFSISIVTSEWSNLGPRVSWLLLPGPVFGLFAMRGLLSGDVSRANSPHVAT